MSTKHIKKKSVFTIGGPDGRKITSSNSSIVILTPGLTPREAVLIIQHRSEAGNNATSTIE